MSGVSSRRLALVAAFAVTGLWSSSWVIIRVGLRDDHLPPLDFAGLRYGAAAVILWTVVACRKQTRRQLARVAKQEALGLVCLGIVYYAVTQGAQFVAIDHQPVATTSLILTLTPILVATASGRLLGEGLGRWGSAAVVLVPGGACLYFSGALSASYVGLIAAAIGLGANAGASLLGRSVNRGSMTGPLVITTLSMTIGAVILLGVGVGTEGAPHVTLAAGGIVAWLAVINTALAFTLWNHSLRHLRATESSVINNAMLVQIALLGWGFLGQRPSPIQWAGMVIVSIGVVINQLTRGASLNLPGEEPSSDATSAER